MRKRSISHIADTVFWYILYLLPVFMYLINALRHDTIDFKSFITSTLGFAFEASNPIFMALYDLFSSSGVLPLFSSDGAIYLATWFCSMLLVHLLVDFVLFIPRLCHKWLSKATQGD